MTSSTLTPPGSSTPSTPKPRDVQLVPIAPGTLALRSRSWNRLRFEIEYALERGTTANSYIISGDKTALIDPPGGSFTEIFLDQLHQLSGQSGSSSFQPLWSRLWGQLQWVTQQSVNLEGFEFDLKQLDYLILGHVNVNRADTLKLLLQEIPNVTIVCSNPAATALKDALPDQALNLKIVRTSGKDKTLDLGQGHRLQLIRASTPRYPDSLLTYDPASRILFSDKFFGIHLCSEAAFDGDRTSLQEDRRYYFDCLMAPYARQVDILLDKLSPLAIRSYAPGHGSIVRYGTRELTRNYRRWSAAQKNQTSTIALLYASAYGNTATIGQALARGITKAGIGVETINCETATPEEIQAVADYCEGFIIGSPTLGGHAPTQIQMALGILLSTVPKTKPVGVFGSFGWSGEAIDLLESKLRDAGYSFGFDPIKVKFKPTDVTLKTCEEAGTDFAQQIKKANKIKSRQQGSAQSATQITATEQAVGRIVGSLCILTAKQGDVMSGMLASWVSQATFNPPGFTVAVAKDRAVESLLYSKSPFVLNILGEDTYQRPMKHFLKPFGPGEDRFAGLETETATNDCPILKDAISYLECEVENRMECGDHWVVYAVIKNGKVLRSNVKTAVHHRKAGTRY
ncbi:MAG: flavin oxidoreductase [Acaryochloridaceae cyanobacterium CSU_3_4]|nr:flavin oxidoreductase [Acaryochloris sp. SU_5_25]NJN37755.1 flavin oxidoreductase [Acaryochloridaceae cyanobacterium CSU_3_4]